MDVKNEILRLLNDKKINEAENILFLQLESDYSPDLYEAAIFFYDTLRNISNAELEEINFSKEEIEDGWRDFLTAYNQKEPEVVTDMDMLHPHSVNQESVNQPPKPNFTIEDLLEQVFLPSKHMRLLYQIFIVISGVMGLLYTSGLSETIVCLLLIVICFALNFIIRSKTVKKVTNLVFGLVFSIMFISVVLMQNPFFNVMKLDKEDRFFDTFSQCLFYYAIGEYDKAIPQFQKSKKYVSGVYRSNWYIWYLELLSRSGHQVEMQEVIEEYTNYLAYGEADAEEIRMVSMAKSVLLLNTLKFDELLQYSEKMFQATNERFYLEIMMLFYSINMADDEEYIDKLLYAFDIYKDSTDSFLEYIELRQEIWDITARILKDSNNALWVVADSMGYQINNFNYYINQYAIMGGIANIQLTDLQLLKTKKKFFDTDLPVLKEQYADIYISFENEMMEYGAHLGSPIAVRQLYNKIGYSNNFDEISSTLADSDNTVYFNFIQSGDRIVYLRAKKHEELSIIEEGRFIALDLNIMSIQPINNIIDCYNETEPLLLNTYVQLLPFDNSSFICARRIGSAEALDLTYLNFNTGEIREIYAKEFNYNYHIKNFRYNTDNHTFTMNFEHEEFREANMSLKVFGRFYGSIDPNALDINYTIDYPNPALEFYQLKRNEDLILPFAVLNKVNGKEILDNDLKDIINKNIIPVYRRSNIDNTYASLVYMSAGELSGIIIDYYDSDSKQITYRDDQKVVPETYQANTFFFIVSKEDETIELKRIYRVLDNGIIKSVYEQTLYQRLSNWFSSNIQF